MSSIKGIVDHSWFFLAEFICLTLAVILWANYPGLSWQPLLLAIAPLLLRITYKRSPLLPTPFDLPLAIFLLTAGIGVWAAYQPVNAWNKFWLIFASILFYYLLSRQSAENLWKVAIMLCLMGFGISIYFFLSNNWEIQPRKFQFISQIGVALMRLHPNWSLRAIHPNDIAGITGLSFPFSIALALSYYRRKLIVGSLLFGVMAGLILVTILLSESRGAWLAVGATAGLWVLWELTGKVGIRSQLTRKFLYALALLLLACLAVGYVRISTYGRLSELAIGRSDASTLDQRFHVFWSDIELIKDVPFTGGGLESFPGLYSTYILVNPDFILGYGHNIFLDATLQQGVLGGIMLLWIYIGSILWLALRPVPSAHSLLRQAILSSLLIICFHGLFDDIVYRTTYVPLLFFVPGMAVGLATSPNPVAERFRWVRSRVARFFPPAMIILGVMAIGLIVFRRSLLSAWYTDLGAVEMAKVELSDFPTGVWDEGQHIDLLSKAELLFNRALEYEPSNPRTHYRLGLIAQLKRNFSVAVGHLEIAHRGDPYHRGMLKALGLSYIWDGQIEAANPLLSLIPESNQELAVYPWWWRSLNRPDLAVYAEQYLEMARSGP